MNPKKIILLLFLLQPLSASAGQKSWPSQMFSYCTAYCARAYHDFFCNERETATRIIQEEKKCLDTVKNKMENFSNVVVKQDMKSILKCRASIHTSAYKLRNSPLKNELFDFLAHIEGIKNIKAENKLIDKQFQLAEYAKDFSERIDATKKGLDSQYPLLVFQERTKKYAKIAGVYAVIGVFGYAAYQYDAFPKI